MRTLPAAILLVPALALAQAAPQARMKNDPKSIASKTAPRKVETRPDPRTQALDAAAENESRRMETVGKTSKKRHEQAPNAKRNER